MGPAWHTRSATPAGTAPQIFGFSHLLLPPKPLRTPKSQCTRASGVSHTQQTAGDPCILPLLK